MALWIIMALMLAAVIVAAGLFAWCTRVKRMNAKRAFGICACVPIGLLVNIFMMLALVQTGIEIAARNTPVTAEDLAGEYGQDEGTAIIDTLPEYEEEWMMDSIGYVEDEYGGAEYATSEEYGETEYTAGGGYEEEEYAYYTEGKEDYGRMEQHAASDGTEGRKGNAAAPNSGVVETVVPYMGGTMTIRTFPDGSGENITRIPCHMCGGTGKCPACHGAGGIVHPYLGTFIPCTLCAGLAGDCKYCMGKKEQVMYKHFAPGEAEATMQALREEKRAARTSGNGGSSGSTGKGNNPEYIDEIYYRPNMTGVPYPDEWCNICQEWGAPHTHIKKRI